MGHSEFQASLGHGVRHSLKISTPNPKFMTYMVEPDYGRLRSLSRHEEEQWV